MSFCRRCGKGLTDELSVKTGYGPVCRMAIKNQKKDRTLDMFGNADFEYDLVGGVVVIYDLDQGGMSVTNDVERVLEKISTEVEDLSNRDVIYRDSQGVFDGISQKPGAPRFYSINETTLENALAKIGRNIVS